MLVTLFILINTNLEVYSRDSLQNADYVHKKRS